MDLTGVVVSYDNAQLLSNSLSSVREFYPELRIILIDGSPKGSECREFVHSITDKNIRTFLFDYNISHGAGLHLGIMISPTEKVLCFDTDIIVRKPPVEEMLELMDDETFTVGKVIEMDQRTFGVKLNRTGKFKYVYPHFHIVNRAVYRKYLPYVHSGAPGNLTFLDIFDKGEEHRIKDFPVDDYVEHKGQGTSITRHRQHMDNWILQTNYFPVNNG